MTSVQYGFEPWVGGAGLAVNSFSVATGGAAATADPTTTSPATTDPTSAEATVSATSSPTSEQTTSGSCAVTYTKNEWSTGFTADITIANTTAVALSGWTLGFSFPGDSQITNSWNATVTQSGHDVVASGASYNSSIAAGGTASFGFQGTYSSGNDNPTAFTLNGTTCAS